MGTYTANYQLYMPSIGEQGWGDLMNGNLTTIDTTMKSLSNSIGTLETEADAFDSRITACENKIGTGTYVANVKAPIITKLTTTNEGFGVLSFANSFSGNYPLGFSFTNSTDTYSVTFSGKNSSGGNTHTVTYYAIDMLTGVQRTLGSKDYPYNTTTTATYNLYMTEIPKVVYRINNGYSTNINSVTKPAIYIGAPE